MRMYLKNDFHNTHTFVHADNIGSIPGARVIAAKKRLCGVDGCTCGGDAGETTVTDKDDNEYVLFYDGAYGYFHRHP